MPALRKRYAHAASKQTPAANKQTPAANKQTPAANKHSIGSDTCTVARLQRSPEYLSLYIDAKMRAGLKGSSEEEVERTLDKVHPHPGATCCTSVLSVARQHVAPQYMLHPRNMLACNMLHTRTSCSQHNWLQDSTACCTTGRVGSWADTKVPPLHKHKKQTPKRPGNERTTA